MLPVSAEEPIDQLAFYVRGWITDLAIFDDCVHRLSKYLPGFIHEKSADSECAGPRRALRQLKSAARGAFCGFYSAFNRPHTRREDRFRRAALRHQ